MGLAKVVTVDEEKCVNCHRCISVCPVKYCNDGSGDVVKINDDLCIGCGECLHACTHDARLPVDDFTAALKALQAGERVVAVVAPAAAANFPDQYLHLNGWLKSLGVDAVFDVSFGAELTVKSYLEYVKNNDPRLVIAQPCPALVSFVQIYHPELVPFLAPADSPMMHTMKMVRKYYPKYQTHKILVVSPCIAKRREFDEVGVGDFNVTMTNIKKFFAENNVNLSRFPEVHFDNEPAERAVLFSTPGGLLETAIRELPEIRQMTRKIEGPAVIYDYLAGLNESVGKGVNPLLVDCLNCDQGCNGGTGTDIEGISMDELEHLVNERRKRMQKLYSKKDTKKSPAKLQKVINKFWDGDLYSRTYQNLSAVYAEGVKMPTQADIDRIFLEMEKMEEDDIKNCSSCGYNTCEGMAVAIFNGLNKKENCHFYLAAEMEQQQKVITREKLDRENVIKNLGEMIDSVEAGISRLTSASKELEASSEEQTSAATEQASGITEVSATFEELSITARQIAQSTEQLVTSSQAALQMLEQDHKQLKDAYRQISQISELSKLNASQISELDKKSTFISEMVKIITEVANKTNLLSLNASIEAARAGEAGRGFSVVSAEIRELSKETIASSKKVTRAAEEISDFIRQVVGTSEEELQGVENSVQVVEGVFNSIEDISKKINNNYSFMQKIEVSTKQQESGSRQAAETMKQMSEISKQSLEVSRQSMTAIKDLVNLADNLTETAEKMKMDSDGEGSPG